MVEPIRRALVSAFDKEGIVPFCRDLDSAGIEILSTGGTSRLLKENGVPVVRVSERTGFPEMLDGRVKTLHPRIHAGILAIRSDARHMEDLKRSGIDPIDLVVANLYPFEKTASIEGIGLAEAVEMIDVGGPTMVRAAAKNFAHVGVVVDPADYGAVIEEIRESGGLSSETRLSLAVKAFRHTCAYDAAVSAYLSRIGPRGEVPAADGGGFPEKLELAFFKSLDLVYGENPHQSAAFYRDPLATGPSVSRAVQLQGKPLSFNNLLDFDGALTLAAAFRNEACAIIKHGNPCGVALGRGGADAFRKALECDPESAFGGVIALNLPVDRAAAEAIAEAFYEGVIAPGFEEGAREVLARKKNLRLLQCGGLSGYARSGFDLRRVNGGLLVQGWDDDPDPVLEAKVVTRRPPGDQEWKALEFAWTVVRAVKSNAIVYALADRTVGIGAGQMSRVDSARLGVQKARLTLRGAVVASDAFFPFRDGLDVAAQAGVTAVIQPGGSIRDPEVIAAADEHGMAMVFTGRRHFRH
jgi:phosphoribosylaminoimidazolecarboxamide formyltransferase/IMP cyclohydrolase